MTGTRQRRGRGDGALFQDARGRWIGLVVVDGKRHAVVARTKTEANTKLKKLRSDADAGLPVTPGDLTVAALLSQWAAKHLPNRKLEASTIAAHRAGVSAMTTALGRRKIRTLTPTLVEAGLEQLAAKGLARATIAKYRTTLAMSLDWAERRGLVARNVARLAEMPLDARPANVGRTLTVQEARALLDAAVGTPLAAMWTVMVYLGLRPGEAAGLAWDDVDLDRGIVHVRRARKRDERGGGRCGLDQDRVVRAVSLEAAPPLVSALRAHRTAQHHQRLAAGEMWANPDALVFTSPTGRPSDPAAVRRELAKIVARAGLDPTLRPNVLRHTAASLMADAGIPIEEVADQLGHRDTRMASLHYRHRIKPTVSAGLVLGDVLTPP